MTPLYNPLLLGQPATNVNSAPNQWAGRTSLSSGSATVIVSTYAVGSDSLIFATLEANTAQNSGFAAAIEVRTIAPGAGFTVGYSDGNARARPATVMWMIWDTSK